MLIRSAVVCSSLALACLATAEEIEIVDTIPGTYVDISEIGEQLDIGDDDEVAIQTTIGNALLPAGTVVVGNNGGIGFDPPDDDLAAANQELPSAGAFGGGQALLPYWDDIGNDVGGVYWHEMDDTLVVQWEDRLIGEGRASLTFQIQIFDASESTNPFFQFIYLDIEGAGGGGGATIGYQDGGAGFNDDQWSFNTAGAVGNGTVLTVMPEPHALLLLVVMVLSIGGPRLRRGRE
jgi:hypothetical protein